MQDWRCINKLNKIVQTEHETSNFLQSNESTLHFCYKLIPFCPTFADLGLHLRQYLRMYITRFMLALNTVYHVTLRNQLAELHPSLFLPLHLVLIAEKQSRRPNFDKSADSWPICLSRQHNRRYWNNNSGITNMSA